ncbi:hypothetical protein B0H15DRAFT_954729 [Mycena belliarum]|uniref:Uncharacterized protein n=1 Tax=Mycena belliarum TaxID=1033014 RepID=A0AAD6TXX1_9AGAR|nr:hypothetical protein B0H15DRAFT_954729 [Mycena belliae]
MHEATYSCCAKASPVTPTTLKDESDALDRTLANDFPPGELAAQAQALPSSTTKSPPPTTDALPPSPKRYARLRLHAKPRPLDYLFASPTLDLDARRPRLLHPSTFLLVQNLGVTSRPARFALNSRHGETSVAAGSADDPLPHPQCRQRICGGIDRSLSSAHRARLRALRAADVADPDSDSTIAAHGGDDRRPFDAREPPPTGLCCPDLCSALPVLYVTTSLASLPPPLISPHRPPCRARSPARDSAFPPASPRAARPQQGRRASPSTSPPPGRVSAFRPCRSRRCMCPRSSGSTNPSRANGDLFALLPTCALPARPTAPLRAARAESPANPRAAVLARLDVARRQRSASRSAPRRNSDTLPASGALSVPPTTPASSAGRIIRVEMGFNLLRHPGEHIMEVAGLRGAQVLAQNGILCVSYLDGPYIDQIANCLRASPDPWLRSRDGEERPTLSVTRLEHGAARTRYQDIPHLHRLDMSGRSYIVLALLRAPSTCDGAGRPCGGLRAALARRVPQWLSRTALQNLLRDFPRKLADRRPDTRKLSGTRASPRWLFGGAASGTSGMAACDLRGGFSGRSALARRIARRSDRGGGLGRAGGGRGRRIVRATSFAMALGGQMLKGS